MKPTKAPTILNTLGGHIKKRRLELGLYQVHVATIIGVDESTVTNWEKNRTCPTLRCIRGIIEFLGYDPSVAERDTPGGKLPQYRESRAMTHKELARRIGIDPTTLGRLEKSRGRCIEGVRRKLRVFRLSRSIED